MSELDRRWLPKRPLFKVNPLLDAEVVQPTRLIRGTRPGRNRVMDAQLSAEVRRGMTIGVILIIVGFAAVTTAVVLLN